MTKVTRLSFDQEGGLERRRIHLREISGDADAPLETVGQDLRAARLRRGDDLATVSRALKIRKDHLDALEEDRFEALPGRTYAIGFVRTYADYLGLDSVQCVERFKAEIAGRDNMPEPVGLPSPDDERRLPHGWVIISIVLLALAIYGAYRFALSADSLVTQPVAPVPSQIAPAPLATVKPPAPRPAAVQANTAAPQPQTQTPPAATPPASNPQTQTADLSANPATPPAAPPAATALGAPLPAGQSYGEANHDSRVLLRVHVATRLTVEGNDGMVYINRMLKPGDTYHVPNRVGLTLSTPDAGAVEVQLDGQSLGYAGESNQRLDAMSLDPQAVMDRIGNNHG